MDGLVHERPAAVQSLGSAPAALVVVRLWPPPLAGRLAESQPAKPAGFYRRLQRSVGIGEARGKDRAQLDAMAVARLDDAVTAFQGDFERLLDNHVLAGLGGGHGRLHVGAA